MQAFGRLIDHPADPVPPGGRAGTVVTDDLVSLRWAVFPSTAPRRRGTVLLLHGRAEFIERWFETVRDLQMRGFGVVTFDWRGQGSSTRLLGDPSKGHVRSFDDYGLDLDAVLRRVMVNEPEPHFVLAHSTGALVAALNEARLRPSIRRAVFTAPLFGLGDFGLPLPMIRLLARVLPLVGLGRERVPGGSAAPIHTRPFEGNRVSSDPIRYARNADLAHRNPTLAVGSPTVGWVAAALTAMDRALDPDILAAHRLPTLVVASGDDVVVSNRAIERWVLATRSTDLIVVPGARHEILQERDRFREQAWAAFDAFVPGSFGPVVSAVAQGGGETGEDPLVQPPIAAGDHPPAVDGTAAVP